MVRAIPNVHPKELKSFIDEINAAIGSGIVVLATASEEGTARNYVLALNFYEDN